MATAEQEPTVAMWGEVSKQSRTTEVKASSASKKADRMAPADTCPPWRTKWSGGGEEGGGGGSEGRGAEGEK